MGLNARSAARPSVFAAALGFVACQRSPTPVAVHLIDVYKPGAVEGRAAPTQPLPRTEWRFEGASAKGWEAFHEVSGLVVRGGRLVGRATGDLPIVHFERTTGLEDKDVVHELEVRLRVSAGTNLSVSLAGAPKLDRDDALDYARNFPWDFKTPIVAGNEARTYTLRTPFSVPAARVRHIFIRPTDEANATFEVESFRIVFRREHLASVPSGVGWQGLSEIYRETIVARSPETARLRMVLPERPWLDLAVGTLEDGPVTFRLGVRRPGDKKEATLLTRTVTRPHRWENASVDLARFARRDVELSLSIAAERPGAIAFWGSPVVRARGPLIAPTSRSVPQRPQGVILVWADTLRRDHLGAYGHTRPTSPNIDRLASEGTIFRDCIGQASWTKVATPSLFTSLYPTSHGVVDFFDRLPASAHTLAESYREAGYATLSMSSIPFTGKFTNLHQGFDEVHEGSSLPEPESSKTAREYVDRLLPWLEAHRDVPFFVFLHVADPHDPYKPASPYDTLFADPARAEEHERQGKEVKKKVADALLRHMGSVMATREELLQAKVDPDAYVGHDRDWYDGSIRGMDAEIGRLAERLRQPDLYRRVLLAFTGDHGEEFLDHGRMFHGQSVYGEMNDMPLILWAPGRVRKGDVNETVETIDVMPTLLEAGGLRVPEQVQGRSLWSLVTKPAAGGVVRADDHGSSRPAISEKNVTTTAAGAPPPRDTESFAVILGGFKLIHNTKRPPGRPEYELFDRRADPHDQKNVAAEHPEIVGRLSKELQAWHRKAQAARLKPDTAGAAMSNEELERLRALGYIQ
jgi:arylsulfatase A-like enzyme